MSVTKIIRSKNGKKRNFYRAQVYVRGLRLADRIFETRASAWAWHEKERADLAIGRQNEGRISEQLTFDQCMDRYVAERLSKLDRVSQDSREVKLRYLRDCPLSSVKMCALKSNAVVQWLEWLLKHETASCSKRKSFIYDLKFLAAILNWYRNYIDADYVVPITKRHRELAHYKKMKPRRPDYYARPEDVKDWIRWLKTRRNPVYYRLAAFLTLTGARIGEAAGLHWEDVDARSQMARVVRIVAWDQKTKKPRLEERAKTDGSIRMLMLPDILWNLLEEMRAESGGTGLVFRNHDGGMLKYNAVQASFNAGFKALGLPWRSTHICRHTYATMALLATRDLAGVQASLGHKTAAMTEKYAKNVALLNSKTAEKTAAVFDLEVI